MGKAKRPKAKRPKIGPMSKAETVLLLLDLINQIITLSKKYGPEIIRVIKDAIETWKARKQKTSKKGKATKRKKTAKAKR